MSQDTSKIHDPHKRRFSTSYKEKFQHLGEFIQQNDENLKSHKHYTTSSNINILQPRKKQRKES